MNIGQRSFQTGLNQAVIGHASAYSLGQAIASVEFYLRALSQPEISAAKLKSKTYPINPACNAK